MVLLINLILLINGLINFCFIVKYTNKFGWKLEQFIDKVITLWPKLLC